MNKVIHGLSWLVFLMLIWPQAIYSQDTYQIVYKLKGENFGVGTGRLICSKTKSFYTYSSGSQTVTPTANVAGVDLPVVPTNRKNQLNHQRGFLRVFGQPLLYTEDVTDFRYSVADDLVINWEFITGPDREIGGYNCHKAQANVRGRVFEVWYTPQLKIPAGPWKLYGLPGLILEAISEDQKYKFVFEKIEAHSSISIGFTFKDPVLEYHDYVIKVDKYHQEMAKSVQQETRNRFKASAISTDGFKLSPKNIEKNLEKVYTATDN